MKTYQELLNEVGTLTSFVATFIFLSVIAILTYLIRYAWKKTHLERKKLLSLISSPSIILIIGSVLIALRLIFPVMTYTENDQELIVSHFYPIENCEYRTRKCNPNDIRTAFEVIAITALIIALSIISKKKQNYK